MTPIEWLRKNLAPLVRRRWDEDCPAGVPVPTVERCAAVDCDSVRLSTLAEGERARVTCLEDPGSAAARKLAALGILPGIDLVLVQRTPAFVLATSETELALDAALASQIRVRKEEVPPAK
ncbi:MAG TPA: FeoA family protein [Gemmatimonadales bacterium]|nr:FeoA family protein [Gemmatimonadales bacterium]